MYVCVCVCVCDAYILRNVKIAFFPSLQEVRVTEYVTTGMRCDIISEKLFILYKARAQSIY
jgi:hypothetical protein